MKTPQPHIFLITLFFFATPTALALSPNDLRTTVVARRQQTQETIQEKIKLVQPSRQQFRANIASIHANRLEHCFTFYHSRLLRLLNKISQRARIMEDEGKDISVARQTIDQTAAALDQTKDKGIEAIAMFRSIDPDAYEAQREIALQARDLAQEARDSFSHTRQSLKQIISLLRQAN